MAFPRCLTVVWGNETAGGACSSGGFVLMQGVLRMASCFFGERTRSATAALHDRNGAGVGTPVVTSVLTACLGHELASMEPGLVPRLLRLDPSRGGLDRVASMEPGLVPRLLHGADVGGRQGAKASMEPGLVPRLLL